MEKFNTYKGYPLVRCGNQLYYGYMSEPYVIWIQILETKKIDGEDITSKVRVIQLDTHEDDPMKKIVRRSDRDGGLYEALDTAKIWLDKALSN
ncbi:MAG: hypothetical protein K2N27_05170 [Ruminococcus sp.]|nr:hypothetical protein [Ruminococcus sp.]MDE7098596.1 hypothetical protein [Ruminococcus sp.]MDE7364264.1 hypothetical protein [Ruminococcus sp.]